MKGRRCSVGRECTPTLSDNGAYCSHRVNLIPRLMFTGHSAELQSLLPHRKPTIRTRANARTHLHVPRCYDDLYDLSPRKKKAKLREARLCSRSSLLRSTSVPRRELLFSTETPLPKHSLRAASVLSHTSAFRSSELITEVITKASALFATEKENTIKIKEELEKRGDDCDFFLRTRKRGMTAVDYIRLKGN